MEKIVSPFGLFCAQFCKDIEESAQSASGAMISQIRSDLQLYDDSEKLEFINSKRIEIRRMLEGRGYHLFASIKEVEKNLTEKLEDLFMFYPMSDATAVEYSKTLEWGEYEYNSITKKIIVRPFQWMNIDTPICNFSTFNEFRLLINEITLSMFYLKLRKLEAKIIRKQIVSSKIESPEGWVVQDKKNLQKCLNAMDQPSGQIESTSLYPSIVNPKNEFSEIIPNIDDCGAGLSSVISNEILFPTLKPSISSRYLQFFKEGAYALFCYLETEYSIDDKKLPTKYSNLFHFLKYHHLIICNEDQYKEFIEKEKGRKMSKILLKTSKYEDDIFSFLCGKKKDFEKRNKKESN